MLKFPMDYTCSNKRLTWQPVLLLLLLSNTLQAQTKDFPKDTAYNLHSAYLNILKDYPKVTPIKPELPKGVSAQLEVVYARVGARELHLDIFYPTRKRKKGRPGVVMIHGGGWRSGNYKMEVPMAQQLAAKGYIALTVEYRLSPEAPYPASVYDLKAAIRWLRANAAKYGLNPKEIAAYGCSSGAELASFLGTTNGMNKFEGDLGNKGYSSMVQAVLNIDGIVSFIHPEASAEGEMAGQWLGGLRDVNWEKWKEASPLEYANAKTPPFLFVNCSIPRFHAGRDDLFKILDQAGTYHELHTIPNSTHSFWTVHPWFEETLQYSVGFLQKVFK